MTMKQSFTSVVIALGGLLLSVSAYAAVPGMMSAGSIPDWKMQLKEFRKSHSNVATRSSEAPGEVISEVEGMVMGYDKTYSGFYMGMDGMVYMEDLKTTTEIVMDYNGYIYIKDIVSMVPAGSYVKGEFNEEGKVVFNFPQTVYFESDEYNGDMWLDVNLFYSSNLDEEVPEVLTENNFITFTVNDDGSMTMDPLGEGVSLSLSYCPDGIWYGFSETAMTFTESTGEGGGITLPEGVEALPYSYIFDNTFNTGVALPDGKPDFGYRVNVAFDGDDVYLGGIFREAPNSWVKGRKEGNKVIIPGRQYLGTMFGVLEFYLMYCKWSSPEQTSLELLPEDTEFVFIYDEEASTFTTEDKDVILLMNASETEIKALQKVEDPTYVYQPVGSGAPVSPWGLKYEESDFFGLFDFNLPLLNEEGVLLYSENMFYNIYVDGELYEIIGSEYGFAEDMTDIPYDLNDVSIIRDLFSTWHEMVVKVIGLDTIGVQCFNVWEGEKYYGPLMELNILTGEITVGVEEVNESANVVEETYFDLSGRKIANPSAGIFVKRAVYDDGTVKVSKKAVK